MLLVEALQETHNVMQVCEIYKRIACTQLIDNKGFNSLNNFCVIDGDGNILDIAKCLATRAAATLTNLGMVQIKGFQDLV